jgi:hypothetical protein
MRPDVVELTSTLCRRFRALRSRRLLSDSAPTLQSYSVVRTATPRWHTLFIGTIGSWISWSAAKGRSSSPRCLNGSRPASQFPIWPGVLVGWRPVGGHPAALHRIVPPDPDPDAGLRRVVRRGGGFAGTCVPIAVPVHRGVIGILVGWAAPLHVLRAQRLADGLPRQAGGPVLGRAHSCRAGAHHGRIGPSPRRLWITTLPRRMRRWPVPSPAV